MFPALPPHVATSRRHRPDAARIALRASWPLLAPLAACTGSDRVEPAITPPGADETARTNVLEAGAALLQDNGPLAKMDVYVVGFHPMKDHRPTTSAAR